jgi:hypothetical protein
LFVPGSIVSLFSTNFKRIVFARQCLNLTVRISILNSPYSLNFMSTAFMISQIYYKKKRKNKILCEQGQILEKNSDFAKIMRKILYPISLSACRLRKSQSWHFNLLAKMGMKKARLPAPKGIPLTGKTDALGVLVFSFGQQKRTMPSSAYPPSYKSSVQFGEITNAKPQAAKALIFLAFLDLSRGISHELETTAST